MSKPKTYLILEMKTGLVDGWYHGWEDNAEGMVKHWDERRPWFKHVAVEVVEGMNVDDPDDHSCYLHNHQLMNKHCDGTAGGECWCSPGMPTRYRCDPEEAPVRVTP